MTTRRIFLRNSALAMVGVGAAPQWLERALYAADAPSPRKKILVAIFQRGAADGLNVVVPHGEKAYYTMRPSIAVPRPAQGAAATAIDLDGFFGLHPSLSPFKRLWDDGILAPVHAVGSPSNTRSHFDAQDYMESGTPDNKGTRDGWLNRYLAVKGTCDECKISKNGPPFRAVAMTPQTPRILEGGTPTVAMNSLEEFTIRTSGTQAERIEALYRTG